MSNDVANRLREALRGQSDVRFAYLFGSVARDEAHPDSDVDVAVFYEKPASPARHGTLHEELERALGRTIDLVNLATAPPLLLREIVRDGLVVLCRDEDALAELELSMLARYLDTQHLRAVQREALAERIEEWRGAET